ncbi:hypothetical protein SAMN05192588_2728 [Nonlabens sp. Hel1_33_55]|uniref:hypothetical protein n=1 Tax=Nonlabens sp. Hel1_33_55 TaxID=1336802 RepID=UPI000875D6DE|nr:hypothetical protein [Nonlabens sp. Hel1_33_55]SCY40942.1 hypothetical protein SAMN05192588_2728 [Nonlabens sp. Hel1_33_55]
MAEKITYFYENWEFWTNVLGILVTAGLGFAVWFSTKTFNKNQSEIASHQLQKELFSEFNKRYDILNGYLEKITRYESLEHLMAKKPNKYLFLRNKLNDYFNLCAEEYYWLNKGRIDKNLWKSWEVGMNSWYDNHRIIREAWKEECDNFGYQSFYLKKGEQFFKKYKK